MASGLNTEYQMTLSFYNEFGDYNVWAKQWDTERKLLFQFEDSGIIPTGDDASGFVAYLRGVFSDGTLMPVLTVDEVTEDSLLFCLTSDFLAVPGRAKAEIVLGDGSEAEEAIQIDEQGNLIIPSGVKILSTHAFYIKIEPTVVNGAAPPSEHDMSILDEWTTIIVAVQGNEEEREEAEDTRRMNEERRQMNEYGGYVYDADGNVVDYLPPEQSRTHLELGYVAQAKSWAIGPGTLEEDAMGTDTLNAMAQANLARGYAQHSIENSEKVFLEVNNDDGHLYMYRAGSETTLSFRISDDKKGLVAILS